MDLTLDSLSFCLGVWGDCLGGDSCCTPNKPCKDGEGDCDKEKDCAAGLVCGNNNCITGPLGHIGGFDKDDDCCMVKPSENKFTYTHD